ncbi:unnamed protein product [Leuciscus chuanchicus]
MIIKFLKNKDRQNDCQKTTNSSSPSRGRRLEPCVEQQHTDAPSRMSGPQNGHSSLKSKGHQEKERAIESTTTTDRFSMSAPSVRGMSDQEAKVSKFDVEDLVVDVGYWFKGSTNRKGYLTEFCELHEAEYMEILMHVSARFRRLQKAFSDPMMEVYPLFFQATIPVFTSFNLLLQREQSSIFLLHDELDS